MNNNILPLVLFDINKNELEKNIFVNQNCFYFYSYQNFDVKIISGTGVLYSVKQLMDFYEQPYLDIQNGQEFNDKQNFGYTIYIPNNFTIIELQVKSINDVVYTYYIYLKLDNVLTEENEHYNDLLINNHLPTFDELNKSLLTEFNSVEMIKRLLLDFKYIIKNKGTKNSIEKFFNLIGFSQEQLTVYEEYFSKADINKPTITPNPKTDIKSGNYHILFDNFSYEGLDDNNLPINKLTYQDLTDFFQKLVYAISIANTYFTMEEQDISFFGLKFSSNIALEPSITSKTSQIITVRPYEYRKDLHIDLLNYTLSTNFRYLIENTLLRNNILYCSEVKFLKADDIINEELFLIDEELFDDVEYQEELENFNRTFGTIGHLNIIANNKFVEVIIRNKTNVLSEIVIEKQLVATELNKIFLITKQGDYELIINFWDEYNARETYFYDLNVSLNIANIDFDVFTSGGNFIDKNILTKDVDSSMEISEPEVQQDYQYILDINDVPEELKDYYTILPQNPLRWLSITHRNLINSINKNFKINSISETLPIELSEDWINIIAFKYNPHKALKIRIFNPTTCQYDIIDYDRIGEYQSILDKLYVTILDIFNQETLTYEPYYFLMTTETGLNIRDLFNFGLVDIGNWYGNWYGNSYWYDYDSGNFYGNWHESWHNDLYPTNDWYDDWYGDFKSIFDNDWYSALGLINMKIPVNYDFPLFTKKSNLVPYFNHYISDTPFKININDVVYNAVKSVYTRLINVNDDTENSNYLKLGDIIFARLNDNYVINERDIVWKIYNTFNNELIYQSNSDYSLKHRISENTCYTIECIFTINGVTFTIRKDSIITSFVSEFFENI